MKEIIHYVCSICGTEYKDKKMCEACEKGHHKPVKINNSTYISIRNNASGYSTQIHIKMDNDEIITYKR